MPHTAGVSDILSAGLSGLPGLGAAPAFSQFINPQASPPQNFTTTSQVQTPNFASLIQALMAGMPQPGGITSPTAGPIPAAPPPMGGGAQPPAAALPQPPFLPIPPRNTALPPAAAAPQNPINQAVQQLTTQQQKIANLSPRRRAQLNQRGRILPSGMIQTPK